MKKPDYTDKVDALLKHVVDFTEQDFLDLAIAALDQGGMSAADQQRVIKLIRKDAA